MYLFSDIPRVRTIHGNSARNNCIIKELNILQSFICEDIIINLLKIKFCTKLGNITSEIEIRHYDSNINLSSTDPQCSILNLDPYYLKNEAREFHQTL